MSKWNPVVPVRVVGYSLKVRLKDIMATEQFKRALEAVAVIRRACN